VRTICEDRGGHPSTALLTDAHPGFTESLLLHARPVRIVSGERFRMKPIRWILGAAAMGSLAMATVLIWLIVAAPGRLLSFLW
jgi:hypothetical protein